jgi:formiminoglutamate deiminase
MYRLAATLTPDSYQRLATAAFAEMALAGITTVGEFHYLHHGPGGQPYDDPNAMGHALLAAASDAGVRMTLLDTCYLHGGIGRPPDEVQQRFSDGDVERWAARAAAVGSSPTVRAGAAVHSIRAIAPEEMGSRGRTARRRHAHVSEQPAENEDCTAAYGPSRSWPAGLVGGRFAVHATHLTATDVTTLGRASVCFCPTTERTWRTASVPGRAGRELALGSDSHAVVDLFGRPGRGADARLATGARGHHRRRPTGRATSAARCRLTDAGHLGVGASRI